MTFRYIRHSRPIPPDKVGRKIAKISENRTAQRPQTASDGLGTAVRPLAICSSCIDFSGKINLRNHGFCWIPVSDVSQMTCISMGLHS